MPDDTDIVIFEITQGCCMALAAVEEMLLDDEKYGAGALDGFQNTVRRLLRRCPRADSTPGR